MRDVNKNEEKCINYSCKYGKLYPIDYKVEELRMEIISSWGLPLDIKVNLYNELEKEVDDMIVRLNEAKEDFLSRLKNL